MVGRVFYEVDEHIPFVCEPPTYIMMVREWFGDCSGMLRDVFDIKTGRVVTNYKQIGLY